MSTQKQIRQPYPLAPGDKDDFFWDWTAKLAKLGVGANVAGYSFVVPAGMTKLEDAQDSGVVRALLSMDAGTDEGKVFEVACTIQTNQSPTRKLTRIIKFVAKTE
ncbi:hypothetical protein ACFJGW_00485 [Burkholderiaceae bacterium UC74_6]